MARNGFRPKDWLLARRSFLILLLCVVLLALSHSSTTSAQSPWKDPRSLGDRVGQTRVSGQIARGGPDRPSPAAPPDRPPRPTPNERVNNQRPGASSRAGSAEPIVAAVPLVATDAGIFRDSNLAPTIQGALGSESVVGEPSVGSIGTTRFQTGNWYAAASSDNGAT